MLAGAFLVLQVVLLLECVYATSEWLTEHPGPWRMAALIVVRAQLQLCSRICLIKIRDQGVGPDQVHEQATLLAVLQVQESSTCTLFQHVLITVLAYAPFPCSTQ